MTQEYYRPYSTINSLWAAARQRRFVPDDIYLLGPDPDAELSLRLRTGLGEVQRALEKEPRVHPVKVDPVSPGDVRREVKALVKKAKKELKEVAVDVTPGRTLAKLAVFRACVEERPHHVFYLDVPEYDYRPRPYPVVPMRLQASVDVTEEVVGRGENG